MKGDDMAGDSLNGDEVQPPSARTREGDPSDIEKIIGFYKNRFNKPNASETSQLSESLSKHGFFKLTQAIMIAGQRDPPPERPSAYIEQVAIDIADKELVIGG